MRERMRFEYGFAPGTQLKYDGSLSKNIQVVRNQRVLAPSDPLPIFDSTPTHLQYFDLFDYIYTDRKSVDWHEGI